MRFKLVVFLNLKRLLNFNRTRQVARRVADERVALLATKHRTPNTKHQTPSTRHQTPSTKHQTPDTRHQTPDTRHQTPNTEHQTPNTKHQTPNTNPTRCEALDELLLDNNPWRGNPRLKLRSKILSIWTLKHKPRNTQHSTPNTKHETNQVRGAGRTADRQEPLARQPTPQARGRAGANGVGCRV